MQIPQWLAIALFLLAGYAIVDFFGNNYYKKGFETDYATQASIQESDPQTLVKKDQKSEWTDVTIESVAQSTVPKAQNTDTVVDASIEPSDSEDKEKVPSNNIGTRYEEVTIHTSDPY